MKQIIDKSRKNGQQLALMASDEYLRGGWASTDRAPDLMSLLITSASVQQKKHFLFEPKNVPTAFPSSV